MTLATVTISGVTVEVYATLQAVKDHHITSGSPHSAAFNALADDNAKSRILVDATRWFNALPWQGEPTTPAVEGTTLKWPRTGVTEPDGDEVDDQVIPADVIEAFKEACGLLAQNSKLTSKAHQGSNIQQLGAGPAGITYFSPTSPELGNATMLPTILDRYLAKYIGGGSSSGVRGGAWYGGGESSHFDSCAKYDRDEPF